MKRRSRAALTWIYAFHSEVMTLSAIYSARGISKRFGVVHALSGVDLDVVQGKVVGLSAPTGPASRALLKSLPGLCLPIPAN